MSESVDWMMVGGGIVLGFLLGRASVPAGPAPPPYVPDSRALEQVRSLMSAGDKIGAITKYRELTGAGLKDSKDAVESIRF